MSEYDHVPGLRDQLIRAPRPLPTLVIDPNIKSLEDVETLLDAETDELLSTFSLTGYQPHQAIRFQVAV